jgi:cell division protease FtsH
MIQSYWRPLLALLLILFFADAFYSLTWQQAVETSAPVSYSRFKKELAGDNIKSVTLKGNFVNGEFRVKTMILPPPVGAKGKESITFTTIKPTIDDPGLMADLEQHKVEVVALSTETSPWSTLVISFLPWVIILGVWWFVLRGMKSQGSGGALGGFAKSGAREYAPEKVSITFADVAGMEETKQELREIIDYLKEPGKFQRLGGKVPRGVLLFGPPGTGKTLLARAVAGEAGVSFFSISASQFIEMFVGVGASRVRDLFATAKKSSPSIIFIDELDAVGRSRGAGMGGGNDEREQTLNQLLSEMDGFDQHEEVVVIAATNRPDVLDQALMRPGRFDRHLIIERPDWRDREAILKVHCRKIGMAPDVELALLARGTPGMTGADLENLINEAAILAARSNAPQVTSEHLEQAKDKVLMGGERKMALSELEKKITAFHEAGHTLVARLLPGTDPIHKVTIIPRGRALGVTQQLPDDDRHYYPRSYLMTRLAVLLGGRMAEKLVFNDISTGAQNDLKVATELAEKMVCQWGMSESIGPVTFSRGEEHPFLGMKLAQEKSFSEEMAWRLDQEISRILGDAQQQAERLLKEHRTKLEILADALVTEETLDRQRIDELMSGVNVDPSVP